MQELLLPAMTWWFWVGIILASSTNKFIQGLLIFKFLSPFSVKIFIIEIQNFDSCRFPKHAVSASSGHDLEVLGSQYFGLIDK
jgi:hypothetical protein